MGGIFSLVTVPLRAKAMVISSFMNKYPVPEGKRHQETGREFQKRTSYSYFIPLF
jgi:hypothetical protein